MFDELEDRLAELTRRRKLVEKKTEMRLATLQEFTVAKEESKQRIIKAFEQQTKDAKMRNMKLLRDVSVSIHPTNHSISSSSSAFKPPTAMKLKDAKQGYIKAVEELLPRWKRQLLEEHQEMLRKLQFEKELAQERRYRLTNDHEEEEKVRIAVEQERRELMLMLALEQRDKIRANAQAALLRVQGREVDVKIAKEVQQFREDAARLLQTETLADDPATSEAIKYTLAFEERVTESKLQSPLPPPSQSTMSTDAPPQRPTSLSSQPTGITASTPGLPGMRRTVDANHVPSLPTATHTPTLTIPSASNNTARQDLKSSSAVPTFPFTPVLRQKEQLEEENALINAGSIASSSASNPNISSGFTASYTSDTLLSPQPPSKPSEVGAQSNTDAAKQSVSMPPPSLTSNETRGKAASTATTASITNSTVLNKGKVEQNDPKIETVKTNSSSSLILKSEATSTAQDREAASKLSSLTLANTLLALQPIFTSIEKTPGTGSQSGAKAAYLAASKSLANTRDILTLVDASSKEHPTVIIEKFPVEVQCTAVLYMVREKGHLLLPSDVFNGVVTVDKLKAAYKKLGGGRIEFWNGLTVHLQTLVETNKVKHDEISKIITSVLVAHVTDVAEKGRKERKLLNILQLAILPAANALDDVNTPATVTGTAITTTVRPASPGKIIPGKVNFDGMFSGDSTPAAMTSTAPSVVIKSIPTTAVQNTSKISSLAASATRRLLDEDDELYEEEAIPPPPRVTLSAESQTGAGTGTTARAIADRATVQRHDTLDDEFD